MRLHFNASRAYRKQISVFTCLFAYHRPQFPHSVSPFHTSLPSFLSLSLPFLLSLSSPPSPQYHINGFPRPGVAISSRLRRSARFRYSIPAFRGFRKREETDEQERGKERELSLSRQREKKEAGFPYITIHVAASLTFPSLRRSTKRREKQVDSTSTTDSEFRLSEENNI